MSQKSLARVINPLESPEFEEVLDKQITETA